MIIYGIHNTITDKWYIGKTTKHVDERFTEHKTGLIKSRHTNKHLQSSYNKHGMDAFKFVPLGSARHEIELNELEKIFISFYNSFENGYNLTTGGDGGWSHKEETKTKISNTLKGNVFAKGFKHTEEWKQEQSLRLTGRNISTETRKKLSDMQTKRWSKGTEDILGDKNPFYGKQHTPESREKMRLVNLGRKHKKVTCNVCGKSVAQNTVNRFHNSNCKLTKGEKE
jgi:group I intron endonuclease